jgi:hypothetical protein
MLRSLSHAIAFVTSNDRCEALSDDCHYADALRRLASSEAGEMHGIRAKRCSLEGYSMKEETDTERKETCL